MFSQHKKLNNLILFCSLLVNIKVELFTANDVNALIHRLRQLFILEHANQLSCRKNLYPIEWPGSYLMNNARNRRVFEQTNEVTSEFNEKIAQFISNPTESIVSHMIISQIYFTMRSEEENDSTIERNAENLLNEKGNYNNNMFLSVEEETTIHFSNYVQFVDAIVAECIIQLELKLDEAKEIGADSDEQKQRMTIALQNWQRLKTQLAINGKRLAENVEKIIQQKFPDCIRSLTYGSLIKMNANYVESGVCERIHF